MYVCIYIYTNTHAHTHTGLLDRRRLTCTTPALAHRAARLQRTAQVALATAGVTAISGGFVAGNHAGLAYSDWPFMGYPNFVPADVWEPALGVRNLFENIATVQFDHRLLAYSTAAAVAATVAQVPCSLARSRALRSRALSHSRCLRLLARSRHA